MDPRHALVHAPSVPTLAMTLILVDRCSGSLFECTRIHSANRYRVAVYVASVCLFVCLSVCLFVCLFVSLCGVSLCGVSWLRFESMI